MEHFRTVQDLVWAAKQNLPADVWDYVTYGTETDTTLRRNRQALDSLALVPRIMRDVSAVDPASSFLGRPLRIPVILAPIGSVALLDPDGGLAPAEVARDFGILHVLSGYAAPGFVAVGRAAPQHVMYGLHPRPGLPPLAELGKAVADAGFQAIVLVCETVFYTRRERDLMNQVVTAFKVERPYSDLLRDKRDGQSTGGETGDGLDGARMDWSMIETLKRASCLRVVVKGVMSPADARLAVEHGADAIYVSNHGGRALDHGRGTMHALRAIIEAVDGRVEIIVDGGFARGTDILKAMALGAKAVCLGKMQAWALAAGGRVGLLRMLQLLEEELVIGMALLGVNALSELSPESVEAVQPVAAPHPLSVFPVVMERLGLS